MRYKNKPIALIQIKAWQKHLSFHCEVPRKWAIVLLLTPIIYYLPELWNAIQIAILAIP